MRRVTEFFIYMPFQWFEMAAELPGKTAVVATLIWHQAELSRSAGPLVLRSTLIERCGLARETVAGALRALESAELITVERKVGAKPRITIAPQWWAKYRGGKM
jgi:hypothetical protein